MEMEVPGMCQPKVLSIIFCYLQDYETSWTSDSLGKLRQNWLLSGNVIVLTRQCVAGSCAAVGCEALWSPCGDEGFSFPFCLLFTVPSLGCHHPQIVLCFGFLRIWASVFPFLIPAAPSPPCRLLQTLPTRGPMHCGSAFPATIAVDCWLPKSLCAPALPFPCFHMSHGAVHAWPAAPEPWLFLAAPSRLSWLPVAHTGVAWIRWHWCEAVGHRARRRLPDLCQSFALPPLLSHCQNLGIQPFKALCSKLHLSACLGLMAYWCAHVRACTIPCKKRGDSKYLFFYRWGQKG